MEGIGLSDGEVMERLWSYLRRFTRMTKEMRPAHRIDVLTHALVYYGMTTKKKIGNILHARIQIMQLVYKLMHTAAHL